MNTELYSDELRIDRTMRLITLYDELTRSGEIANQKEFAEKIGISPQFFTEIKKGRSLISIDKLQKVDESLIKYHHWLLTGEDNPFKKNIEKNMNITEMQFKEDGKYVIPESLEKEFLEYLEKKSQCTGCQDKEKIIKLLEKHIALLEEQIEELKRNIQSK